LNTFLYQHQKFRYAELGGAKDAAAFHCDPRNLFLNGVLDRKQGTCISMPVLYIAVADRLGYPVRGVNANDHFFCRWDDGRAVSNIEATSEGGWSADEDYIRDMKVTPGQIRSGAAMRSLTRRELIGNFFFARAAHYAVTGRPALAERDLLKVIACNPRDADGYANLAQMYARAARRLGKAVALDLSCAVTTPAPTPAVDPLRARPPGAAAPWQIGRPDARLDPWGGVQPAGGRGPWGPGAPGSRPRGLAVPPTPVPPEPGRFGLKGEGR